MNEIMRKIMHPISIKKRFYTSLPGKLLILFFSIEKHEQRMLKIIELSATIDHKVNLRQISQFERELFRSCGKLQKSLYDACLFNYSEESSGNKIKHSGRDSHICEISKMSEFTPSLIVRKYKTILILLR